MKKLVLALAFSLAGIASANAAAPNGNVSNDTLAKLGLSGMQRVSDAQGMNIRGKGFIVAVNASIHNSGNTRQTIIAVSVH